MRSAPICLMCRRSFARRRPSRSNDETSFVGTARTATSMSMRGGVAAEQRSEQDAALFFLSLSILSLLFFFHHHHNRQVDIRIDRNLLAAGVEVEAGGRAAVQVERVYQPQIGLCQQGGHIVEGEFRAGTDDEEQAA